MTAPGGKEWQYNQQLQLPQLPPGRTFTGHDGEDVSAQRDRIFFIVGIIALTIAAKFGWPELLGTVPYFSYGRLRPLHVNGMLFGWLLAADMGLAYYIVPRLCGVKLWSEKLGIATAVLWNVIILGAVFSLLGGYQKGLEYAELPTPVGILVVIAWVMFGVNIFATIATRKYQQMYVSIWYIMGTILWTAFVYLTGNFATGCRAPASTRPTSTGCTCTTPSA